MAASVREAVGIFHDQQSLERAIDELLASGFDRADISLVASHEAVERERAAVEALQRHSAEDVHVHELPATDYVLTGGVSRKLSFMQQLGL